MWGEVIPYGKPKGDFQLDRECKLQAFIASEKDCDNRPIGGAMIGQLWGLSPTHCIAPGRLGLVLNTCSCVFPKTTRRAYHATTAGGTRSNANHPNMSPPLARSTSGVVNTAGPMSSRGWPSTLFRSQSSQTIPICVGLQPGQLPAAVSPAA